MELYRKKTTTTTSTTMCVRQKRRSHARRLLVVLLTSYSVLVLYRQLTVEVNELFASPFADDDLQSLKLTLGIVLNVLNRLNVTYFMASGTLLGSYRHHGRIPWDDDVDLIVNSSDKELIWKSLTALKPDYGLFLSGYIDSPYHWKVYPRRHGRKVPLKPFRWPFVDLLFFRENVTHVWNESPWFWDECWPRSAVFPLRRRPFDAFQIPAPCDVESVLGQNFDMTVCVSRGWTHVYDAPIPWRSVKVRCSVLAARHPMVVRHPRRNIGERLMVTESLVLANRTLHTTSIQCGC